MEPRDADIHKKKTPGRLLRVILVMTLGVYALMGWLRLHGALTYWDYFHQIHLKPGPLYLAISGGLIGFSFSLAVILFLAKSRIAGRYGRWLAGVFLLWFWIDRIFFSTREAFFFQLEISVLISLATFFWAFVLIQKKDLKQKPPKKGALSEDNGNQT